MTRALDFSGFMKTPYYREIAAVSFIAGRFQNSRVKRREVPAKPKSSEEQ
jgi:hypothetical protein